MEVLAAIYGGLKLGKAVNETIRDTALTARETADIIKRADQKPGYRPGLSAAKKGTPASREIGTAVARDPPGNYNTQKNFAQRLIAETGKWDYAAPPKPLTCWEYLIPRVPQEARKPPERLCLPRGRILHI